MFRFISAVLAVLTASVLLSAPAEANEGSARTYGIHLFFDETEFVDVLTLVPDGRGSYRGHMSVPNDFEGEVTNLKIMGEDIEFDLFVPKNQARPVDLVFKYKGKFFDASLKQLTGFVTIEGSSAFTASFVAFERES